MRNSAVEDIKSRINIVDFIGQYLRLNKAGANWKALCPFHNEKTPSFMVHEDKQIWHCFGCGKGGDIFGFLMEMESLDFKEALKILAEKAGVELPKYKYEKEQADDKNKILEILELAAKFYETQLWKGTGKEKIIGYLRNRALKDETIKEFRLGYAPAGWRNMLTFLTGRGYKTEEIEKTGLLVKKTETDSNLRMASESTNKYYDRFRDRIIFPINDLMGKVIGFSARVAPGGDESQAKYVNTPETIAYHKSKVLYGIDKAKREIKDKDEAVLVEGNTDVMAAHQAGIKNTVAVSGTALTPDQLDILKRYSQNLKMFFDMDPAGQAAVRRSAEIAFQKGLNVYVIESAEGKDAAEIVQKNPVIFIQAVKNAWPAMEYFLRGILKKYDKSNSIDKKKIAVESLEIVKFIGNEIERNHWTKKIAQELEVEARVLIDALKKIMGADQGMPAEKKEEEIMPEERSEMIQRKIIGLMLAFPEAWKFVMENEDCANFLKDDPNFQLLSRSGQDANFEIDKFLVIIEDERLKRLFKSLAFQSRYQFDEETGVEEFGGDKAVELVKRYIAELKRESKKKGLKDVLKDIKKAEAEGNKEELKLLIQEFNKLSKNLK